MPYGITQRYLPPDRGEKSPYTSPSEAGTWFSDSVLMQGWVDLFYVKADRPGIEPATCQSQVQCPTAEPTRNTTLSISSTYSDIVHPCDFLRHCPLIQCPLLRFQPPPPRLNTLLYNDLLRLLIPRVTCIENLDMWFLRYANGTNRQTDR